VATVLHPSYHGDTFIYDVAASDWQPSTATGPMARGRAAFAMDPGTRKLYLALGRYRDANAAGMTPFTLLVDAWAYDVAADRWQSITATGAPPGRAAPVAVWDAMKGRVVVFGGDLSTSFDPIFGHQSTGETWQLAPGAMGTAAWSQVTTRGMAPSPRYLAAAALDSKRNRMLVFGGVDEMGTFYADTWALDLANDTWSELDAGSGPDGRLGAAAAYDEAGDRLIVFGGHDTVGLSGNGDNLNDTWAYSFAGSSWTQPGMGDQPDNPVFGCAGNRTEQVFNYATVDAKSPERRERMMLVAAGAAGAILYGGEGDCAQLDDTWAFVAGAWSRLIKAAQGESCRRRGEQCACLCN
jgi:hypothetical protein